MATPRSEVYKAIDTEREYQDKKWVFDWPDGSKHQHEHSVTEWLVYMRDYTEEALHFLTREADPEASAKALHWVRKVAALGVVCMEQLGAPTRK